MSKKLRLLALASTLAVLAACRAPAPRVEAPAPLVVMTYNLRYAADEGPNAWAIRRTAVAQVVRDHRPDLIGTQEGLHRQLTDLEAELPDYAWVGTGRDGGLEGEFMAVFYRRERLEPLEVHHFWLSDTPEVVASVTWGHSNRRMVTWVRFADRATGGELLFWNTHFDHRVQLAREKSAELVLRRVRELRTPLPVVLAGDFNAAAGKNTAYATLVGPEAFEDTWESAERRGPLFATFNGWEPARPEGDRIDWILTRGVGRVLSTEIVTDMPGGRPPSDHWPVVAVLEDASSSAAASRPYRK